MSAQYLCIYNSDRSLPGATVPRASEDPRARPHLRAPWPDRSDSWVSCICNAACDAPAAAHAHTAIGSPLQRSLYMSHTAPATRYRLVYKARPVWISVSLQSLHVQPPSEPCNSNTLQATVNLFEFSTHTSSFHPDQNVRPCPGSCSFNFNVVAYATAVNIWEFDVLEILLL